MLLGVRDAKTERLQMQQEHRHKGTLRWWRRRWCLTVAWGSPDSLPSGPHTPPLHTMRWHEEDTWGYRHDDLWYVFIFVPFELFIGCKEQLAIQALHTLVMKESAGQCHVTPAPTEEELVEGRGWQGGYKSVQCSHITIFGTYGKSLILPKS